MFTVLEPLSQDSADVSSRMGGQNGLFEGDIVGVLNRETAAVTGRQKLGTKVSCFEIISFRLSKTNRLESDLLPVQFTDAILNEYNSIFVDAQCCRRRDPHLAIWHHSLRSFSLFRYTFHTKHAFYRACAQ